MKELNDIRDVEKIEKLEDEYDLQRASLLERKLKILGNENPELIPLRKKLRKLIKDYESTNWLEFEHISDSKFRESDKAEEIVNFERIFVNKRKEIIRSKLKEYDMTQQELGILLGHPKSYMSELINGVSQFTMKDLVIIHRVFGISLDKLIPTYLQSETRERIQETIEKLNKPRLDLQKTQLIE